MKSSRELMLNLASLMRETSLPRQLAAEFMGTGFLVMAVVGSGIMAERLSSGNVALALLANTIATGAALVCLILTFGPISGAHFNPAVSVSDAIEGGIDWKTAFRYSVVQSAGGIAGAALANLMFQLPVISISRHSRSGSAQFLAEVIATFGLMSVIWGCSRMRSTVVPFAVAAYIVSAYWFTASTSFANPAVTIARAFSDTFAGIRPQDVLLFVPAQMLGAVMATLLFRWLLPALPAERVAVPKT
ncbi:MAG TPA: MIP/aquaporin family protein [Terriglobales bacterium]|nr:MIP/aquaporin family protein [Terriglobales bacterium]